MEYWSLLFVPCLLWSTYHYYEDRHKPEPVLILFFTTLLGYASAYIGLYLYQQLASLNWEIDVIHAATHAPLQLFLYCILAIGPIEELAKFIPFIIIIIHLPHFDEPLDGVIYASFIALGFSFHENRLYLLYMEGWEAIARAVTSPMVHVMFASIWGYAYGYADTHKINRVLATVCGLLAAMFLHGVYDFFSIKISVWTHIIPPLIIGKIWLLRAWAIRNNTPVQLTNN